MKNGVNLSLVVVSLLAVFLVLAVWTGYGQGASTGRQTWEYKNFLVIVAGTTRSYMEDGVLISLPPSAAATLQKINSLGGQGWEMTGVAAGDSGVGYWFKRPR